MWKRHLKQIEDEAPLPESFIQKLKCLSVSTLCDIMALRHPLEPVSRSMKKHRLLDLLREPRWFPNDREILDAREVHAERATSARRERESRLAKIDSAVAKKSQRAPKRDKKNSRAKKVPRSRQPQKTARSNAKVAHLPSRNRAKPRDVELPPCTQ